MPHRPTPLPAATAAWALLALAAPALAQVRVPGSSALSEHTGSIGEGSRPVGEGSRSMHDGTRTIGESSGSPPDGIVRFGPVRDGSTRGMLSGPVSSLSRGSMTQPRTLRDGGSITASSAGAVKHDIDKPLGSRISQPLRELFPLQEQLRALRQHGDAAAIAAAAAPLVPAPPDPGDVDPDAAVFDDADWYAPAADDPLVDGQELIPAHAEEIAGDLLLEEEAGGEPR